MTKHFLQPSDFSKDELLQLLQLTKALKSELKSGKTTPLLPGKTLGMIFEKPSNRTRVSFEVGMYQLGGYALYIQQADIGMGQREPISDVARVLSRYVDAVMIRAKYHTMIEEFARYATIPVINGLSDQQHPCQALADIFTIQENKGRLEGLKIVYVGDGNNVCQSLIEMASLLDIEVTVSCPSGFEPKAKNLRVNIEPNIQKAVEQADVIYTDVWVSMGQEAEAEERLKAFKAYTLTMQLVAQAKADVSIMHCLPAHRGQEIEADVMSSPNCIVFDQAENRLHAQKAVLATLLNSH